MVICLERGADLHMSQLMPLPLTVSCFSKIQIGFSFLVPAHLGSPGERAVKRVCVYDLSFGHEYEFFESINSGLSAAGKISSFTFVCVKYDCSNRVCIWRTIGLPMQSPRGEGNFSIGGIMAPRWHRLCVLPKTTADDWSRPEQRIFPMICRLDLSRQQCTLAP